MSQAGVFLGYCRFCNGLVYSDKDVCSECGKNVTDDLLVYPPSRNTTPLAALPLTEVLDDWKGEYKKEQIMKSRLSSINPYCRSGALVCDDSNQKMWLDLLRRERHHTCYYAGNTFCITSYPLDRIYPNWYNGKITDCAYQVHIKSFGYLHAGIVFRIQSIDDSDYKFSFYKFCIRHEKKKVSVSLSLQLGDFSGTIQHYDKISVCDDISKDGVLLGVVAQKEKIDLYVNMAHIGSVDDFSISKGDIGLWVAKDYNAIFTHAKVWAI